MRILDRYLIRQLLVPFFYCMAMFLLLWVIADLLGDNLADFVAYKSKAREVLLYYWIVMPRTVVLVLPLALILSLLYAMSTMSRHNELTAMRAGGMSLSRLVVPYLGIGVLASVAVFLLSDRVVPQSMTKAEDFMSWQKNRRVKKVESVRPFFYTNRAMHREWMAEEFRPDTGKLIRVRVMLRSENNTPVHYFSADSAVWRDGAWWFHNLISVDYDEEGQPKVFRNKPVEQQRMDGFKETPDQLRRAIVLNKPDRMSTEELLRRLDDDVNPLMPLAKRQLQMAYYERYAFPWICVVVVLIGIPFGITTNRKGQLLGVANSLGLFFAYYVVVNIDRALGLNGYLPPVIAAWMPNITFGIVGSILLARVR